MIKRISISIAILAASLLVGIYIPADLVRHPLGTFIISAPAHAEILSSYTLRNDERIPFDGKSDYGNFWAWRRGLNRYHGLDVGPREDALENIARDPFSGYLIYSIDGVTNAIVYLRAAGWTSGAILGELRTFEKDATGQWQNVANYRDDSDGCLEGMFRMEIVASASILGIIVVFIWNIWARRQNKRNE